MSRIDDAFFEWTNGCYDEDGNGVNCEICGEPMTWNDGIYICKECSHQISRADYFNYIGAEPPDVFCFTCDENYPMCKKWCGMFD